MNELTWNNRIVVNAPICIPEGLVVDGYSGKRSWFGARELANIMIEDIRLNWWEVYKNNKLIGNKDPMASVSIDKHIQWCIRTFNTPPPGIPTNEELADWCTYYNVQRNQFELNEPLLAMYKKALMSRLSWLSNFRPIQITSNITLSEYGQFYHRNAVHMMEFNKDGYLVPRPVEHQYEGMGLTKPRELVHGIYSTIDTNFFGKVHVMKKPKRLRTLVRDEVTASLPDPITISKEELPLGVSYISSSYAARCSVTGRDGLVYPLMTGDKIICCLPDGTLVKMTCIVIDGQIEDMIIGHDCDKGICEYNTLTRFAIQSRASERINVGTVGVPYQLSMLAFPGLAKRRIATQLDLSRVWMDEVINGPVMVPNDTDYGPSEIEEWTPAPSIRELVSGKADYRAYADLFYYPITVESDDEDEELVTEWMITSTGSKILHNRSIKGFEVEVQAKIVDLMIKAIKFPVKGMWAVAVPLRDWVNHEEPDETDHWVSIPRSAWLRLGKPRMGCVIRYPVKGKSSLVKVRVMTHSDHDCIEVSPLLMIIIENGDFDGDLIQFIADFEVTRRGTRVAEAFAMHMAAKVGVDIPQFDSVKGVPLTDFTDADASFLLQSMDSMGLATVARDILIGKLTEEELLSLFEWLVQPAIARKEGATNLSPFDDEIDGMTGAKWLVSKCPFMDNYMNDAYELVAAPTTELAILGGYLYKDEYNKKVKPTLDVLIAVAKGCANSDRTDYDNPQRVIVSAFASLVSGF